MRGAHRARPCARRARRRRPADPRRPARSARARRSARPASADAPESTSLCRRRHACARATALTRDGARNRSAPRILARARQMPRRLDELVRDHHRGELPGHRHPRQPLSVLAIGLDPIAARPRRVARRHHRDLDPDRPRRPVEPEAGRAGLIDRPHRPGSPLSHATASSTPGPNRARRNSPVSTSTAAACVDRACTSNPAMSSSRSWPDPASPGVSRSPFLRPDKPPYMRKGPASTRQRAPTKSGHSV